MAQKSLEVLIEFSENVQPATQGDFGTEMVKGRLVIHPQTYKQLERIGVIPRDAVSLVSYCQIYERSIATALNWTVEDVRNAYKKLKEQLTTYLPARIFDAVPIEILEK